MAKLVYPTLLLSLLVGGCGSGDFTDLDAYMAEMQARPVGTIDPIPTFKPYKAYTYAAQTMRPPFDPMPEVVPDTPENTSDVTPDLQRSREFFGELQHRGAEHGRND